MKQTESSSLQKPTAMASSSLSSSSSPSSFSLFFLSSPRNPKPVKTPTFSLLSSPKPRIRRPNRLRPKLPTRTRQPEPSTLQTPPQPRIQELEVVQEEEKAAEPVEPAPEPVQELTHQSQTLNPLPNPNSFVLDLSLRFAALLAVQTAAAVWIFGGGAKRKEVEEEARVRVLEKEEEVEVKEGGEVEMVVREIRGMAREAREQEVRERKEVEGEMVGVGMEEGLRGGKVGPRTPRRKLGFVRANVGRKVNVGKGFGGAKTVEEGGNGGDDGGIRLIAYQNPIKESSVAPPELTSDSGTAHDSLVLPYEKSLSLGDLHSSQKAIERSGSDIREASLVNHDSARSEIHTLKEGEQPSSTKSRSMNDRSKSRTQKKEVVSKSVLGKYKNSSSDKEKKPWWLKLPFVLAIVLRRGYNHSGPKGLYSLKVGPGSEDGGSASYTIVFQDQGDATNFCYLLESFFEEMDDFNANVIPLTINELEEGVRSGELKVLVVRKGQLQLYVGQPLAEVETALRSLLDKQQLS